MSLFGSGMGSTGANMINKNITSGLPVTTSRECQLPESWNICTDTSGKEGLSETRRPDLVPVMRLNHSQKTNWFVPQTPLWGILFLRLEGTHLWTQDGVFDGGHYALLCVKAKLFSATRDHKCLVEVCKRLSPYEDY